MPAAATTHQVPRLINNHDLAPGAIQIHFLGNAIHDDLHYHRLKVFFAFEFLKLKNDKVLGKFNRCPPLKVTRIYTIFCVGFESHGHMHQLRLSFGCIIYFPGTQQVVNVRDGGVTAFFFPYLLDGGRERGITKIV